MFYDRHIDQLVLCTIYGVCRVMRVQPEVTFGKLMDAYIAVRKDDQGERACRVILRHVKLVGNENDYRPEGKVVGNLIVFYNQVYVPRMQKHFTMSHSLKMSSLEYRKKHPLQKVNGSTTAPKPKPVTTNGITVVGNPNINEVAESTKENVSAKSTASLSAEEPKPAAPGSQVKEPTSTATTSKSNVITEQESEISKEKGNYDATIIAKVDDGNEVKVVEKASIDAAKPTENGTQKRTFSSLGGPKHHLN